jgi:hypothetical protein
MHSKKVYSCPHCGKGYDARNSLWYHEQKCAAKTKKTDATSIAVIPEMEMEVAPTKCIKKLKNPSTVSTDLPTASMSETTTVSTTSATSTIKFSTSWKTSTLTSKRRKIFNF